MYRPLQFEDELGMLFIGSSATKNAQIPTLDESVPIVDQVLTTLIMKVIPVVPDLVDTTNELKAGKVEEIEEKVAGKTPMHLKNISIEENHAVCGIIHRGCQILDRVRSRPLLHQTYMCP